MLLFSSSKKHKLKFSPLSHCDKYLELAANWFTNEWGYLYDKNTMTREEIISTRIKRMSERAERIYMAFFGGEPIGMFSVEPKEYDDILKTKAPITCEAYYIYIDENYRNLGLGLQMMYELRRVAKDVMKAEWITFETLNPGLNSMYSNKGAKVVCEYSLASNSVDTMIYKI